MQNSRHPSKKLRTEEGVGKPTSRRQETDPTLKKKNPSNKKTGLKQIAETHQFLVGNYRGALQEYLQKQGGGIKISFDTKQKNQSDPKAQKIFICTCNSNGTKATGEGKSKREATHQAALAFMKKTKLVPASVRKSAGRVKPTKAEMVKKTKAELLEEREIDEEEKTYTGTVKFYRVMQSFGFITIEENITFKNVTTDGKIYVAKEDIVCYSEEVGLNKSAKVMFKIYKDSMGLGAYEVQNEDGTPINFVPKKIENGDKKDGEKGVKSKKKKKMGPMIENKQYISGNFRGALQEWLNKKYTGMKLEYDAELQKPVTTSPVYIATCKAIGDEEPKFKNQVGTGHASSKKRALHFAALDYMLKLHLLSAKQHFKIHPQDKDGDSASSSK